MYTPRTYAEAMTQTCMHDLNRVTIITHYDKDCL